MSVVKAVFRFALFVIWTMFPFVCIAQGSNAGVIAGVVLAPDGIPIISATVTLSAPDVSPRMTTSADDGTFLLRDLPSGDYTVAVTAASFARYEMTTSVAVGRGNLRHLADFLGSEHRP